VGAPARCLHPPGAARRRCVGNKGGALYTCTYLAAIPLFVNTRRCAVGVCRRAAVAVGLGARATPLAPPRPQRRARAPLLHTLSPGVCARAHMLVQQGRLCIQSAAWRLIHSAAPFRPMCARACDARPRGARLAASPYALAVTCALLTAA
jgi:hypothetical protein